MKYLAKLLSPLSKSQYTVQSTKEFINHIKKQKVPSNYKMISFDVISLFTNFRIDVTIEIILKRIYKRKEINTSFTKQELKELILLCAKGVQFTLCSERYIQTDGVAIGYPLGPVLSGIFMVELENNLVPTLSNHLMSWKRYVDDTSCFIKEDSIEHVMSVLNDFHPSIRFTNETESNNRLSFLDVLIIRNGQSIETCVYRKPPNTDICIHWNSFAPIQWKCSTLKTLVYCSYLICSNDHYLTLELKYLRKASF